MATREYIGARYVPKFYQNSVDGSTQWQPNVVYEPLMWVTLQNSHMYISKKQVPATVGTPAENIDYWLDIGSYNGIIQDLQNDIDALDGRIISLNSDLESLTTRVNRKFIFIGDSYAFGFLPGGDEIHPDITGFYQRVVNWLGLASTDYKIEAYGRAGFIAQGVNGKTWYQDVDALDSDDEVTDIYVMGGLNDVQYVGDGTPIVTAIQNFVALCKTKFPNARVKIGFCGRISSTTETITIANLRKTILWYKSAALMTSASYLVNSENILKGFPDAMASDHAHPTNTGQDMLGYYVKNDIVKGEPWLYDFVGQTLVPTYTSSASAGVNIKYSANQEDITFYAPLTLEITGTFSGTLMQGQYFELCGLNTDAILGSPDNACIISCMANVFADNKGHLCNCNLMFNNNKVFMWLFGIESGAAPTVTTVSGIYVFPFSATIPKSMLI